MTPERHSETPPPPQSEPTPAQEEPPAPLPTSIQAGKPLPTVEEPQPEDLPAKDYQLVSERYEQACGRRLTCFFLSVASMLTAIP